MRYSTGLSDSLFGEKIILQGPDEKGKIVKLKVTKKWLEQAQGGGKTPSSHTQVSELVETGAPTLGTSKEMTSQYALSK